MVTIATRFGGSATKGLADQGRVSVLVDLPSNREPEFRAAILTMVGETPGAPTPATATQPSGSTIPAVAEKKSFVVQVVEQSAK